MNAIEIARKFAAYDQVADAQRAYTLVLQDGEKGDPADQLEAALYLLQSGGDYKIAYTCFQSLYNRGQFQDQVLNIMTRAFYQPNVKLLKVRYEKNCKLLTKYPYLFRKDFLPFEELPIRLYPFDDNGYTPFYTEEGRFGPYYNPKDQVVSRNFFKNMDNPILAADVYSQYELEYLNDSVRKSEWVARENHIYLHYTDWGTFCAYLQVLNLRPLLEDKKFVFLIGDEISHYPIDFQARFGIDYSQYPVRPFGIREINRLIWHTQLSSHNGGDFFNEIFFGHPNLLAYESLMFNDTQEYVTGIKNTISEAGRSSRGLEIKGKNFEEDIVQELIRLNDVTEKDVFVAYFLSNRNFNQLLDKNARITPAIFFQPHFSNIICTIRAGQRGQATLISKEYQKIRSSKIFQGFKYIKTFTPIRRPTTSYGASVKFMAGQIEPNVGAQWMADVVTEKVLNRSFMVDWQDRLYKDSVLVRFEDGKLNPKATFTALAAFLDIPYTQSMTYCSGVSGINPESLSGNDRGFDPAAIYRTYDDYANDAERCFLEFFLRDVYQTYGYDFQYYDGGAVDEARVMQWVDSFSSLDSWSKKTAQWIADKMLKGKNVTPEERTQVSEQSFNMLISGRRKNRLQVAKVLMNGLNFVNENGQPLHMMPLLRPDPALLEQPLYH